jgi:PPM family protein phosphatase
MKFSVYQRTEQGGRKKNEDRMGYTYTKESALFVVADGMGGHAHGELAAQIALETITELFKKQAQPALPNPRDFLSKALMLAHHQILHFSNDHGLGDSPRTTVVAMIVQEGHATWAHCGDSRLYWIRGTELVKRTLDHSYVEQKPVGHNLSAEVLAKMVNRNVLFTCLGSPTKPIFDISPKVALAHLDQFILCSDGLWGNMSDDDLVKIVAQTPISRCIPALVDFALKQGGQFCDNVTAVGLTWDAGQAHKSADTNVETDSLSKEVFASTVQNHLVDIDHIEFKDIDIEQSLKEINDAILRSMTKPT